MPDKEWTDTEWLDAGWADMERRLDKAMPVTDRRRRAIVWWWSGGAALLGFLLAIWWGGRDFTPEIGYFPLPGMERAQVAAPPVDRSATDTPEKGAEEAGDIAAIAGTFEAEAEAEAEVKAEAEAEVKAKAEAEAEDKAKAGAEVGLAALAPQDQERPVSRRTDVDRNESQPVSPELAVAEPARAVLPTEETETEATDTSGRALPLSEYRATDFGVAERSRAPVRVPALLESIDLQEFPSPAKGRLDKAIIPVRSGAWHFGAEVTAGTDGVGANGTSLGALLRRSGDSRWSVQAGLRYHYWEQTWGLDEAFKRSSSEDASNEPDTSAFWLDPSITVYRVAQSSGAAYRILVARDPADNPRIRTHWLELPLRTNYRFAKRWEVSLGLRPAFLLNSRISVPAVAESFTGGAMPSTAGSLDLSNEQADQLFSGNNNNRSIVGPSGKILRRWHLGWEAGLDYRLAPHWTLGIQYRQGQNVWQRDSDLRSGTGLVGLRVVRWW